MGRKSGTQQCLSSQHSWKPRKRCTHVSEHKQRCSKTFRPISFESFQLSLTRASSRPSPATSQCAGPTLPPLFCTLATGHFHLGTVTMTGGFGHILAISVKTHRSAAPPHKTSTTAHLGGEAYTATSKVAVQTPAPLPHLQIGPRFRLRQSMEQAAETKYMPVPQTDDGFPFCLSYHLKGVCNSNCGGHHAHRTFSSH